MRCVAVVVGRSLPFLGIDPGGEFGRRVLGKLLTIWMMSPFFSVATTAMRSLAL